MWVAAEVQRRRQHKLTVIDKVLGRSTMNVRGYTPVAVLCIIVLVMFALMMSTRCSSWSFLFGSSRLNSNEKFKVFYTVKGVTYTYDNVPVEIVKKMDKRGQVEQTRVFDELVDLLRVFSEACDKCSVNWWLDYGSCLGWARNGAIIPWDDDIDVYVDDDKKLLSDVCPAIRAIDPTLALVWCGRHIKLARKPHCNPFIDIFYKKRESNNQWVRYSMKLKGGEWRTVRRWDARDTIPHDKLFPLKKTTFHGVKAYVPRDPKFVMEKYFGENYLHTFKATHIHNMNLCGVSSTCVEVCSPTSPSPPPL